MVHRITFFGWFYNFLLNELCPGRPEPPDVARVRLRRRLRWGGGGGGAFIGSLIRWRGIY